VTPSQSGEQVVTVTFAAWVIHHGIYPGLRACLRWLESPTRSRDVIVFDAVLRYAHQPKPRRTDESTRFLLLAHLAKRPMCALETPSSRRGNYAYRGSVGVNTTRNFLALGAEAEKHSRHHCSFSMTASFAGLRIVRFQLRQGNTLGVALGEVPRRKLEGNDSCPCRRVVEVQDSSLPSRI
jgi:hypothetical protein